MSKPTERLYYSDSYLASFRAQVLETSADGSRVILDRTAFYPTSGGQPYDLGEMEGVRVVDVLDEDDRIVHVLAGPLGEGNEPNCTVDWDRRFDHMQQHTGQHLLSAVLADLLQVQTVSFHMGAASSTIDLAASSVTREQLEQAERRANAVVQENRPVHVDVEDAATVVGLRKATERTGLIRVVTIDSLDRSACGGTHVRSTGEIGAILLRSTDKMRGNVRLEFVCGGRAVECARADYNFRTREYPQLAAAAAERLKDAEKASQKLLAELAGLQGRTLYAETNPNDRGLRIARKLLPTGPLGDEVRSEANAFTGGGKAVYVAVAEAPPSVLLASSADSGVHCGNLLKPLLAEFGGRGGGAAALAQGSFAGDARAVLERLLAAV